MCVQGTGICVCRAVGVQMWLHKCPYVSPQVFTCICRTVQMCLCDCAHVTAQVSVCV